MVDPLLEQQLAARLDAADNPDWYLTLYGAALETCGDPARALRAADLAAAEQPQPPPTAADAALKRVADACALYRPGADPGVPVGGGDGGNGD